MKKLLLVILLTLTLVPAAGAWPLGGYRGHECGYYRANGIDYAMCWAHNHQVSTSTCASAHQHHYTGWKRAPGGYYVRLGHDHHVCASIAPHLGF